MSSSSWGTTRSGWGAVSLGLAVVLVGALVAPAWGQAPPVVRRVEFDEAVRLALERNPNVATAAEAIREAEVLVRQATALTRPTVGATVNNTTIDTQIGFSGGVTQPRNQFVFAATASMPIVAPTRWAEVNQARDRVDVATQDAAEARRQVAMATAQAYLAIIASRRQIDVDARALETARAHLEDATNRFEGGLGSRLNQLRAAQAVSEGEVRLENSRLAVARAQEALGVLMAEDGPVDSGAAPALEAPTADAERDWMTTRPDLLAQTAVIRSAERVISDAWKVWLPTATAAFEPRLVTPTSLFQPSRTWRLVFSVSQRIFDTGPRTDVALKRVALDRAQLARRALEIQARSEIRIAREAVLSYERALESGRRAAEQASEVQRISTAAFEVGATTNLEVIDAQRSARDADTAVTVAEDAVRRSRLDLLAALGRFPQ